jgi:hypothetical protein
MFINMGGKNTPSIKKVSEDAGALVTKLNKFQKGTKRSPKPTSPTKPSAGNVRIKETVKETTQKSEMLNKGQFKSKPKN